MSAEPLILPARASDLDAVCVIADATFTLPWPRDELALELTRPYSALRVLRPSTNERVVGFLNYWRLGDELQVMNVAVLPEHQRRGYAGALLRDTKTAAQDLSLGAVWLEVRRGNLNAIRLYEAHRYTIVGVRQRYYADNGEDALVMKLDLRPG